MLLNLVGNAIKFTDTGEVRITARSENGHFAVSVADTGPGIPADQLTRVFEQFHQVDNSNTKKKGGTGLGLAIAKQIVEMHGGRIWVEVHGRQRIDVPDGGSHPRRISQERDMSRRIVVVEDHEDLPGVLLTLLTGSGYTVVKAVNGRSGGPTLFLWTSNFPCSMATMLRVKSRRVAQNAAVKGQTRRCFASAAQLYPHAPIPFGTLQVPA